LKKGEKKNEGAKGYATGGGGVLKNKVGDSEEPWEEDKDSKDEYEAEEKYNRGLRENFENTGQKKGTGGQYSTR